MDGSQDELKGLSGFSSIVPDPTNLRDSTQYIITYNKGKVVIDW